MDTYDPKNVQLSIGQITISEFMDGSFITASLDEDTFMLKIGADGEAARARNRNEAGKIVFTLMQSSQSNTDLTAAINLDKATGTPPGNCRLYDGSSGTEVTGADCYILKPAEISFDKEIQGREWTIIVPKMIMNVMGIASTP